MSLQCEICGERIENKAEFYDYEIVCNRCGASFHLDLAGYYEDGSNERIEGGEEFDKWKKKWKRP